MLKRNKKEKEPREYRGIIDEIREQQSKTNEMTRKEKFAYFWYYYKVHTIVAICIIFFLGSLIHDIVTAKDYNFYGIMLNSSGLSDENLVASFGEYAGLDLENYECFIDTTSTLSLQSQSEYDLSTNQRLIALTQTKDLDVMVLDGIVCQNFSYNGMLADLREVLTEEELARYEGQIYYVDNAAILAEEEAEYTSEELIAQSEARAAATLDEINAEAESHRDPSAMEDPIPVGIYLEDSAFIEGTASYNGLVPIYTICVTSQRTETAKQYLAFLFDESIPFEEMLAPVE